MVANGIIYLGDDYGYLFAIRADNGLLEWTPFTINGAVVNPTVAKGTLYVAGGEFFNPSSNSWQGCF